MNLVYTPRLRWVLCASVMAMLFGNHYARDSVGALEKQMEDHLGLDAAAYNAMNALYFLPNIFMPLVAGVMSHKYGAPWTLMLFLLCAAVGHVLFAFGALGKGLPPLLLIGRLLQGISYEVVDTMTLPVTSPYFSDVWGKLSGIVNGFIRLGSVVQFLLLPVMYENFGVGPALWTASLMGVSGLACGLVIYKVEPVLKSQATENENAGTLSYQISQLEKEKQEAVATKTWAVDEHWGEEVEDIPLHDEVGEINGGTSTVFEALRDLQPVFWLFACAGMCMYGTIVPFWFMGSKFIQLKWHWSVSHADAMMLLPEGVIVLVAPPLGMALDKYKVSRVVRMGIITASMGIVGLLYALLALTSMSPGPAMFLLGLAYALANVTFWASIPLFLEQRLMSIAAGVVGAMMNVLPATVPVVADRLARCEGCSELQVDASKLMTLASLAVLTAGLSASTILYIRYLPKASGAAATRYHTLSPAPRGPHTLYSNENEDCWAMDDEFDDL